MAAGRLKVRQEVVSGLAKAVETVRNLSTGANTGKLKIRVDDVGTA